MANKKTFKDYTNDMGKITEICYLSKSQFLEKYQDEEKYNRTIDMILTLLESRNERNDKQCERRAKGGDESRKKYLDYYYKHREEINAKRRELSRIKREQKN